MRAVVIQPRNSDTLLAEATRQELVHVGRIKGVSTELQIGRVVEDRLSLGGDERRIVFSES